MLGVGEAGEVVEADAKDDPSRFELPLLDVRNEKTTASHGDFSNLASHEVSLQWARTGRGDMTCTDWEYEKQDIMGIERERECKEVFHQHLPSRMPIFAVDKSNLSQPGLVRRQRAEKLCNRVDEQLMSVFPRQYRAPSLVQYGFDARGSLSTAAATALHGNCHRNRGCRG